MNSSTSSSNSSYDSTTDPDDKLILYVDPETKTLMKYKESDLILVPDLDTMQLSELITQPFFQDNTMLFETLLRVNRNFVMCVYPPGSGKSTIARLFKWYLSKNATCENIQSWLNTCEFQKAEDLRAQADKTYEKFRSSSSFVLYLDFSKIKGGTSLSELQFSYRAYLFDCWKSAGLPEDLLSDEKILLREEPRAIWTSLSRLRSVIHTYFSGNLYIILDSLDNIYNLIANLPISTSKDLYSKFTKDILVLIDKDDPKIKVFSFGVSPYLITEFQRSMIFSIIDDENDVGKFFSYSDKSIKNVIDEWKLKISVADVKSVAQFQYNENIFINPYLSVSYLKSLKDVKTFSVNISPKSLWMSCIFKEEDLKVLFTVLKKTLNLKFKMNVTMKNMCTIPESSKSRELYYPLFVFGGYLSCTKEENKTYTLFASNETVKILLNYHLELLFLNKFAIPLSEFHQSGQILTEFLAKNFPTVCATLSQAMSQRSSLMNADEIT